MPHLEGISRFFWGRIFFVLVNLDRKDSPVTGVTVQLNQISWDIPVDTKPFLRRRGKITLPSLTNPTYLQQFPLNFFQV